MTDHDENDENQAVADDEPAGEQEADAPPSGFTTQARATLSAYLESVAIPRLRAGTHREEAAFHVRQAAAYLGGAHVAMSAGHVAWALAHQDCSRATRGKLPLLTAIAARWQEVREALPEGIREGMEDRSWATGGKRRGRVAQPVAPRPQASAQGA